MFVLFFHALYSKCAVAAELVISPDDLSVLNNSMAILQCSARGEPPPIITWIKSGKPMFLDDDRIMIIEDGSLIITSVILNDTGMYQCRAENELGGVDSDSAMLTVDGECMSVIAMFVYVCVCVS